MVRALVVFLLSFLFCSAAVSQQTDTTQTVAATDTVLQPAYIPLDSTQLVSYSTLATYKQSWLYTKAKAENNIQQLNSTHRNRWVLFLLMLLLGILTYIKVFFGNEMQEMISSLFNQNLSQQIFRTQSGDVTFSSFLLNMNFVVTISLYVQFIFNHYMHHHTSNSFYSLMFLIFLFTFFYVAKIVAMRIIGFVFEVQTDCAMYIYNFTTLCKTLGLALIPALFVFFTAPKIFFDFVTVATLLLFAVVVLIFVWRGLSTASKLMYRSVYHFFIYVCVVEISSVFLFFKLLTKTII